ncbi:MAG: HDIG domain-containing protein [Rhodocyclaceae bacterium]|nr:HDIG domain-containing protein [Rhodocyclaceae bacterium]MBP6279897.1 HDIG domain-containing protein [Rhodocyclaceae bacterium]
MSIDRPSAALGNVTDTEEVEAQVLATVKRFAPGHDLNQIETAFGLLRTAFAGELPGYQPLKTLYHNNSHTNEVVLCSARMLHGLAQGGRGLDSEHIDAAIVGALMHDIGYLMTNEEASGTGAQFTTSHVNRGVEFAKKHLVHISPSTLAATVKVIQVTDHRQHPDWVKFDNPQQQLAAYATATADLIGQMANREYIERLLYLYFEFEEAKLGGFTDIHDLLEKTISFYRLTKNRLDHDLTGLSMYLPHHFAQTIGEERNFYTESINRNLTFLGDLMKDSRQKRFERLKRGGIVDRVLEMQRPGVQ